MNADILTGPSVALEFTLESSLFQDRNRSLTVKESLLLNAIELCNILPDHIFGHKAVAIYTLIAARYNSLKVSGKDYVL